MIIQSRSRVPNSPLAPEKTKITHRITERKGVNNIIEKFTEDMFNLHYFFQVTELVHCMNSSKSNDEDVEGIWIHRLSVHKQEKII